MICAPDSGWCVDKRVNIGTLMGLVSSLVVVISLVVGLNTRLQLAEEQLGKVEQRIDELRETAIKVERIEERVLGIRTILLEIKDDLKTRRGA